eukprot:681759-Pelagomonas_calceolata.AAC.3
MTPVATVDGAALRWDCEPDGVDRGCWEERDVPGGVKVFGGSGCRPELGLQGAANGVRWKEDCATCGHVRMTVSAHVTGVVILKEALRLMVWGGRRTVLPVRTCT